MDFHAAQSIWADPRRIEVPARTTDESRWLVIGQIDGRCWSAVVTYRHDRVRICTPLTGRRGSDL
ncbi:BrnT family toxin [Mycolicibacter sinensis]|uniref:BrnT family toxin n=1 Tax=Mycolicibacter sinensis (strain JDM601) TaxID=875328 RepID=UPI003D161930